MKRLSNSIDVPSSFRDPSGFLLWQDGSIYRQVNAIYRENYEHERNYLECVAKSETNILPLLVDLTNPSPGIGWENRERMSLAERGPADTALTLALVHHLAISNNVPLAKIACFFNNICNSLIIEFAPKPDSQVQRLLATREDIFPDYTQQAFETEFRKYFTIQSSVRIRDSERTLYLMQKSQK